MAAAATPSLLSAQLARRGVKLHLKGSKFHRCIPDFMLQARLPWGPVVPPCTSQCTASPAVAGVSAICELDR